MNDKGAFVFSYFGPETFNELASAIRNVLGNDFKVAAENFLNKDDISEILKINFGRQMIIEEKIVNTSASLSDLLSKIRS